MIKLIGIAIMLLVIGACASAGNRNIADTSRTSQISEGISTKDDIQAALGAPNYVSFESTGREIWFYVYGTGQIKPATFIPVVGIVVGGAKSTSNTYTVYFNKQGVVENISQGQGYVESGMFK
jgi:outer membrane protein assembly factor BamE (lipoprotein component of BamABCDE complex)